MPPFLGGGEMIKEVRFDGTVFNDPPHRFEAGTPNIAMRERELLDYATQALQAVPGLRIIGTARDKAAVISFLVEGAHAHDLATLLDQEGIAVRSGHHCAHPLMQFYGVPATARASLAFWNTTEEIDALVAAIGRVRKLLG
jgi:cysteine desulfurase/selenocysteine lyase